MAITRKFLGWASCPLTASMQQLCELFAAPRELDLHKTLLVLPGSRAGRQLQKQLAVHAAEEKLRFLAPQSVTIGSLPERLYRPRLPFADSLTQSLAWVEVIKAAAVDDLVHLAPGLADNPTESQLLRCAESISRLHRELAGEMLTFSQAAERAITMEGFPEQQRWRVLTQLQDHYLRLLDDLDLWDLQTARMCAIKEGECRYQDPIVLIGTTEINATIRQMLNQVSDHVISLVFAPAEEAERFDELGCLLPSKWEAPPLDLRSEQFLVAEDPQDEAELALKTVMSYDGRYSVEDIVIGIPDQSAAIPLQRQFADFDVPLRTVVDQALSATLPYRLLQVLADFLQQPLFDQLAALLRHADVCRWLDSRGVDPRWLAELDSYFQTHLPLRIDQWLGDSKHSESIQSAVEELTTLVEPVRAAGTDPADSTKALATFLQTLYGDRTLDRDDSHDHRLITAFHALRDDLHSLGQLPQALLSQLSATEAIRILLQMASDTTVTTPHNPDAIELLGWLELPLDTSPAVILTSFNEGVIPESLNSDLFLPDGLRRHLQITDNSQRYARDAYALCLLQNSGRELVVIARRRDTSGEPLQPSRFGLLETGSELAQRVLAFWSDSTPPAPPTASADRATSFLVNRPPDDVQPPESMSVTSFRDYLQCPYRYYLNYIADIESIDDAANELGGAQFGNVLHNVLAAFGESDLSDADDAVEIRTYLLDQLKSRARWMFGEHYIPAVGVQLGQAARRLEAFADWQAERRLQGWQIHAVEQPQRSADGERPAPTIVNHDDTRMSLTGRIDRIDFHPETESWALFDYKTNDTAADPEKAHLSGDSWIDLQLPLYRHLAKQLGVNGEIQLGFIVLPKDTNNTGERTAEWTNEQLQAADSAAADVWKAVQACEFWLPAESGVRYDSYGQICQVNVFERTLEP